MQSAESNPGRVWFRAASVKRNGELERRTLEFALLAIKLFSTLSNSPVAQVLGRQLLRAGTSVGAQYREAMRAKSVADFVNKLEGSLQEVEETCYWLELLVKSKTAAEVEVAPVSKEADELTAMLVASVKTAKRRRPEK
jgi:four helix bundle protein